jgi:hypothetical protein
MRVLSLVTHLQPDEAYALIGFLDQLRDALMQSYEGEIRAMLQQATVQVPEGDERDGEVEPF